MNNADTSIQAVNDGYLNNKISSNLMAILDSVSSMIYVKDTENDCILFTNKSLRNHFEKELKENTFLEIVESSFPRKISSGNFEVHYKRRNRWYEVFFSKIKWIDDKESVLCTLNDISEKRLYQKRIEQQAYTDFLTGLYNRMRCERDLEKFLEESKKSKRKGYVCCIDLDDFKHINDGLGHHFGDMLLKNISYAISSVEGIEDTCYRMGGDEFVIIVPPSKGHMIDRITKDVKNVFQSPWNLKGTDYYCTMSMGIVKFPFKDDNVSTIIKKADIAMYESKKSGKNCITKYTSEIEENSADRLTIEKNMRHDINNAMEQFEVYFQPIMEKKADGSFVCKGSEALVRWNSKLGFLSPSEFIPLAEYLGLISPIGNHVLLKACKACKMWNDEGMDCHVNVNLSVVQLLQPDIEEIVETAIIKSGIKPENLILEITESLAINDIDRTRDILSGIKKLGVKFALDDFGTGYSSLNNIRALPFDYIKVDQNFVKDLTKDSYSRAFIKMIAELADAIGAEVCVEGIETGMQMDAIKDLNIEYIQGFYFDYPITKEEFEDKYVKANLFEKV